MDLTLFFYFFFYKQVIVTFVGNTNKLLNAIVFEIM